MQTYKRIPCILLGHKLFVSKTITAHIKEYTCIRCNIKLTTNKYGGLTKLTPSLVERNEVLSKMYAHKLKNNNQLKDS